MCESNHLLAPRFKTKDVLNITGWSRWTLTRRVSAGKFPAPERVGDVDQDTWPVPVVADWMEKNVKVKEVA